MDSNVIQYNSDLIYDENKMKLFKDYVLNKLKAIIYSKYVSFKGNNENEILIFLEEVGLSKSNYYNIFIRKKTNPEDMQIYINAYLYLMNDFITMLKNKQNNIINEIYLKYLLK